MNQNLRRTRTYLLENIFREKLMKRKRDYEERLKMRDPGNDEFEGKCRYVENLLWCFTVCVSNCF